MEIFHNPLVGCGDRLKSFVKNHFADSNLNHLLLFLSFVVCECVLYHNRCGYVKPTSWLVEPSKLPNVLVEQPTCVRLLLWF